MRTKKALLLTMVLVGSLFHVLPLADIDMSGNGQERHRDQRNSIMSCKVYHICCLRATIQQLCWILT